MQAPGDRQSHPKEPSKFGAGVRIDLEVRNQSRGFLAQLAGGARNSQRVHNAGALVRQVRSQKGR